MAVKDYKANVDLRDVADKLGTQVGKLQFGVLSGVDYLCARFKSALEADKTLQDEVERVKAEMIVQPVMQAVNSVRSQEKILRMIVSGKIKITKGGEN